MGAAIQLSLGNCNILFIDPLCSCSSYCPFTGKPASAHPGSDVRALSPRAAAFGLASLIAVAVAADLLWMPVQVSDSLGEILDAQRSPSVGASFVNSLHATAYLRPMRIAQIKALFDLAGGEHYWLVYRGFHAVLLVAAVILFTAALRVKTSVDFAASAFALCVLLGLRTFRGTVQEAFPINHFLEMVVFCLITVNLARSRGSWWSDVGAAVTFVVAALTLESGLLVWVVALTAWAVGWRGISARGMAALTLLAAGYMYLRFVHLATGVPDLTERSSGFLFAMLEPEELQQRFGAAPAWFYAYNVASSALSVLFSEPSGGIFKATHAWLYDELLPRLTLPVATSVATTALLVWAMAHSWRRRAFDDTMRFVVLFGVVVAANSMLSYAYTKDEIMSVAGAFYALAAFAGVRLALEQLDRMPAATAVIFMLAITVLATGWSVRAAGVHYLLRTQAFKHQNDWVHVPGDWRREERWPDDPAAQSLIRQLHDRAVGFELPNTRLGDSQWFSRTWED